MNIFQMLRKGMLGFRKRSSNNRKMTPGRVAEGKSTFKGCELEHQQKKLKKDIEEKARMIFAIDIKLDDPQQMNDWEDPEQLKEEKQELGEQLNALLELYEEVVSSNEFDLAMEELDQEERHRRNRRSLALR